jgi:TolA-binding protein
MAEFITPLESLRQKTGNDLMTQAIVQVQAEAKAHAAFLEDLIKTMREDIDRAIQTLTTMQGTTNETLDMSTQSIGKLAQGALDLQERVAQLEKLRPDAHTGRG